MQNFSQTQLSNIMILAGVIVPILVKHGVQVNESQVQYILTAIWTLGWSGYSYYQRYKKGDLTIAGARR